MQVEVLFGRPQSEIATIVHQELARCRSCSIVTGFATESGVMAIAGPIQQRPQILRQFVIGAGTFKGFDALDRLLGFGVPVENLRVHLGHTRPTGWGQKNPFVRFHPMMHSKIYYFDISSTEAVAIVGSHNATLFALTGMNGEASVLLRAPPDDPEMLKIQQHLAAVREQATVYSPDLKAAFAWWAETYFKALELEIKDGSRDAEATPTIIILAARPGGPIPATGSHIYFEIPAHLPQIKTLGTEVHIFLFDDRPQNPVEALSRREQAAHTLFCKAVGIEQQSGGFEFKAQHWMPSNQEPVLLPTTDPFRPPHTPDMLQVRVKVERQLVKRYEYLFETEKPSWTPEYDEKSRVQLNPPKLPPVSGLRDLAHEDWMLVRGLRPADDGSTEGRSVLELRALEESRPDSGNYVLYARRRRQLGVKHKGTD